MSCGRSMKNVPKQLYNIIIQEVFVKKMLSGDETNKGKVVGVVTALGESLPVEEYEFA